MTSPVTLAEAWARIALGEPDDLMLAEFLDSFYLASTLEEKADSIRLEPPATGNPRLDALAGAVAEYLARQFLHDSAPAWAFQPCRYLEKPWHTAPAQAPALIEYLTWASPAEFKSRNIFTDEQPLRRARRPQPIS